MVKFYAFLVLIFICINGCVAQSRSNSSNYNALFNHEKFEAPLGITLTAETGEYLFVEGSYIKGEQIIIEDVVNKMIPGSMMIPFPIRIDPCKIQMTTIVDGWKYFCAESEKSAASFPGLGSVVRDGDCIGIRQSVSNGKLEWVVDNSNYNKGWGKTIWKSGMSESEEDKYYPQESSKPFKIQEIIRIVFNGYYGKQLHFTFETIEKDNVFRQEFTFDYIPAIELPVSIKGHRLTIIDVDNISLKYRWDSIKS